MKPNDCWSKDKCIYPRYVDWIMPAICRIHDVIFEEGDGSDSNDSQNRKRDRANDVLDL